MSERNATTMGQADRQFALLSALLLPGSIPAPRAAAEREPALETYLGAGPDPAVTASHRAWPDRDG